jgi:hypothetical protein
VVRSGISPPEVIVRNRSAVPRARCQTLFGRSRRQCAFRRNSQDIVEIAYHVGLIGKAASMGNISPSRSMSPLHQDLLDSCTTRKLLGSYPEYAAKPAQQVPLAYLQIRGKLVNARRRITPQAGCGATYRGIGFARAHVSAQEVGNRRYSLKAGGRLGDYLFKKLDFVSIKNVTQIDLGI